MYTLNIIVSGWQVFKCSYPVSSKVLLRPLQHFPPQPDLVLTSDWRKPLCAGLKYLLEEKALKECWES